jgi:Ca-activated chloride channel family protein
MSVLHQAFANPLGLFLLALLPVLGVMAFLAARRRRRILARFGAAPALKGLASPWGWRQLLRRACLLVGLVLLIVAIAGPQWGRDWEQSAAPGRDLVVVLDLSRSMLAEDVLPNRVERAKQALAELSYTMQQHGGHRLALVAFAARARLVCPLTHDYDHFRAALAELDATNLPRDLRPDGPESPSGTRIGAALSTAVEAQDPRFRGYQDILLLSDGDDPARDEEWREGVEAAHCQGIPVHTIGVGNPNGDSPIPGRGGAPLRHHNQLVLTRLQEQPLRAIAEGTGGTYTPARTDALPLGQLFRTCMESRATHDNPDDALPLYRQRYAWFLGSALLFLSLEMVLGWTGSRKEEKASRPKTDPTLSPQPPIAPPPHLLVSLSPCLLVCLLPWLVGAISPEKAVDFVRQGKAAFDRADFVAAVESYDHAEESTTDPGLVAFNKAAALYHLGRYREAELHYRYAREQAKGLRAAQLLYNLGNCIVQQAQDRDARRLKEAIGFYELCMQQPATDAALLKDARHNLEVARLLWLKAKAAKPRSEQDDPEQGNEHEQPSNQEDTGPRGDPLRMAMRNERGKAEPLRGANPATTAADTEQPPPPGKGNLPTLPDTDELAPLSAEDAAEYLQQAATRILRERLEYQRQMVPTVSANVMDW